MSVLSTNEATTKIKKRKKEKKKRKKRNVHVKAASEYSPAFAIRIGFADFCFLFYMQTMLPVTIK